MMRKQFLMEMESVLLLVFTENVLLAPCVWPCVFGIVNTPERFTFLLDTTRLLMVLIMSFYLYLR